MTSIDRGRAMRGPPEHGCQIVQREDNGKCSIGWHEGADGPQCNRTVCDGLTTHSEAPIFVRGESLCSASRPSGRKHRPITRPADFMETMGFCAAFILPRRIPNRRFRQMAPRIIPYQDLEEKG